MKLSASCTAAWWARSICAATCGSATAHKRRHRLHRGEGQVIAGDRLGPRPRLLGDRGGDLAGIDRIAAMLGSEELPRHLGADPRPICRGDRLVPGCPAAA